MKKILVSLFLLIFSLMLTNSIYFILMFTVFILILLMLNHKSVKHYIDLLKNIMFLLFWNVNEPYYLLKYKNINIFALIVSDIY